MPRIMMAFFLRLASLVPLALAAQAAAAAPSPPGPSAAHDARAAQRLRGDATIASALFSVRVGPAQHPNSYNMTYI
eukprot:SAG22_NODE_609_length_8597_cov_12.875382_4_plen_76_part_00